MDIYQKLVKGYTEKQWGRDCKELPAFIIKRLPVRYTYDNNYFNDLYQGIPIGGYNVIIDKLFEGCDVETGVDYLENREKYDALGDCIVYTGTIDSYYGYQYGKLEYRSRVLSPRCWTPITIRVLRWSTTPTGKLHTPE